MDAFLKVALVHYGEPETDPVLSKESPLTASGVARLHNVAAQLMRQGFLPDVIYTSPERLESALELAKAFNVAGVEVTVDERLREEGLICAIPDTPKVEKNPVSVILAEQNERQVQNVLFVGDSNLLSSTIKALTSRKVYDWSYGDVVVIETPTRAKNSWRGFIKSSWNSLKFVPKG